MDDYSASPEPFDAADAAFRLLCAGPQPLSLHAAKVAAGRPARPVPLPSGTGPADSMDAIQRGTTRRKPRGNLYGTSTGSTREPAVSY